MKVMVKYLVIFSVLSLAGCAMPKTESQLLGKNNRHDFCSKDDIPTISERIKPLLGMCYGVDINTYAHGSAVSGNYLITYKNFSMSQDNEIIHSKNSDGSETFIITFKPGSWDTYYAARFNLGNGENECATKIQANAMNSAWNRHIKRVEEWINEKHKDCSWW